MEIEMESEELLIAGVCRTCLSPSNDSFEALDELSFQEICRKLVITFGNYFVNN